MNDKHASESPEVVTSKGIVSSALLSSASFIDCAAFLRRPERRKAGTMIVMRSGVTSQEVVDTALELGMAIRWATKEETGGRGGAYFVVLPNEKAQTRADEPLKP